MTIGPIDYSMDVISPFQRAMQGWQRGTQMTEQDNILAAQTAEAERKQQVFDQEQLRQKEMLAKRNEIITKGANLKDVQDFIFAYPEFSKPYEPILGNLKDAEKQDLFLLTRGAYNAMENNRPDIAKSEMGRLAKAYENSGKQDWADSTRQFIDAIDTNPKLVKYQLGGFSTMLDPNAAKTIGEEARANEMQPYEIAKKQADTAKTNAETNDIPLAATDRAQGVANQARNNELENQYKYDQLGQLDRQFYASLDKTERIEADKLRSSKAESSIQRVERLEKVEGYANAAKQAADASNLAAKLANQTGENGGAYWDRLIRQVPGTSENTFAKDIETLKSQVFLAQVEKMRGLGALTDKEGDAIRSSIASLDINQGPQAVQQNLTKIAQQMSAAAKSANRKAQLYATRGNGYSRVVIDTARERGVTPAEMQKIANELGIQ